MYVDRYIDRKIRFAFHVVKFSRALHQDYKINFRNNLNWSNYYKGHNRVALNCPGSIWMLSQREREPTL